MTEFAALTEVSGNTVRRWIARGMPCGSETMRGRAVFRIDDPMAAAQWLEREGETGPAHRARMAGRMKGRPGKGPSPVGGRPGPDDADTISLEGRRGDPLVEIPGTMRQWRALLAVLEERTGYDVWRDATHQTLGYDGRMARERAFDAAEAERVLRFFLAHVREVKGDGAREIMRLERWQAAYLAALFGFRDASGLRRFRKSLIYVPRKNGKTTMVAGIGLLVLRTDGEEGMEGYCAAEDRDQATIVWDVMQRMVQLDPELQRTLRVYPSNRTITMEASGSFLRAIPGDASGNHGSNPHLVLVDELHTQRDRELVEVLETGMAARSEPLSIAMTTADFDRPSLCNERYEYAKRVRDGIVPDPRFLPLVFEATPEDDWRDPATWAKANPNLGVSIPLGYFEDAVRECAASPSKLNGFLRLHLNVRTRQDIRWMDMDLWDACDGRERDALGEPLETPAQWRVRTLRAIEADVAAGRRWCWGGLDLASTGDTTCLALLFTPRDWDGTWMNPEGDAGVWNPWVLIPWYWVPAERAAGTVSVVGGGAGGGGGGGGGGAIDRAPYALWARTAGPGALTLTPGNVVDYDHIVAAVVRMRAKLGIVDIAFDRWNATQTALALQDTHGIPMIQFGQGFASMSAPTKMLEALVGRRAIDHGGNPILRYQVSCAQAKKDAADNLKLDKARSTERIDGAVASVMALGRAMAAENRGRPRGSVYDTRGVVTL